MQQEVVDLLLEQEEVGWRQILYDLVRTEQMDPWDVNITMLTQKYIDVIRKMQELNLRVSGKILLAAAFLLKIKSSHLVDHDIAQLDNLIHSTEDLDEEVMEIAADGTRRVKEKYQLIPRNPQPRNRKVSIADLVEALQRAMTTKKKILARQRPVPFMVPARKMDIVEVIKDLYHKIAYYTQKNGQEQLAFSDLLPSKAGKQEKVHAFIPLLHLEHEQRIETTQEKHFEEIWVKLKKADRHLG